ncbi:MAG: DUF2183 domain-containing protein [Acidobacteria bacterium]|nr:DUF2183 domain-containing protein [Acidobacteriota bacterium]
MGLLAALALLGASRPVLPAPAEELLLLYPSYLTWDAHAKAWRGEIRGRVYEPAFGPSRRAAVRAALGAVADPTEDEQRIFESRAEQFAYDSERGKRVAVTLRGRSFVSRPSRPTGQFAVQVTLDEGADGASIPFRARLDAEGAPEVEGVLRLVGTTGVSVISDIDDTVKDSNVLDRSELVANTFYREYRPVAGMPDLYGAWRDQGVAVHYLTASPWQLFPALWEFLAGSGLGGISIDMREVRLRDRTALDLLRDPRPYKTRLLREILQRFPARSFVLVGDSGEHDPEIYASAAREHPHAVRAIFIRAVTEAHRDPARYTPVFAGLGRTRWTVFGEPAVLPRDLAGWLRGEDAVADPVP